MAVPSTYSKTSEKQLIQNGFKIVIYANQMLRAAYPAMQTAAKTILKTKELLNWIKKLAQLKKL